MEWNTAYLFIYDKFFKTNKFMQNKKTYYPLTISQNNLLPPQIITRDPGGSREYDALTFMVEVKKSFSSEAMEKAYHELLKRNDALRLRFVFRHGRVMQYISPVADDCVERLTFENKNDFNAFVAAREQLKVGLLSKKPVRAFIIKCGCGGALMLRVNHFLIDGYSIRLLLKQVIFYYNCYFNGIEPERPKELHSIMEFLLNDGKYRKSEKFKKNILFWKNLYQKQRRLTFPVRRRKAVGTTGYTSLLIQGDMYIRVQKFCRNINITVPAFLQYVAAAVVYRMTGHENFNLSVLSHGRSMYTLKETVGCLMNLFPVFYDFKTEESIRAMMKRTYMECLDDLSHSRITMMQHLKFAMRIICRNMEPNLFWLLWSNLDFSTYDSNDMICRMLEHKNLTHQLYCAVTEKQGAMARLVLMYQSRLFSEKDISDILVAYRNTIELILNNDNAPVSLLAESWDKPLVGRGHKNTHNALQLVNGNL